MTVVCLGTVQFGLDYGITNCGGKPSADRVRDMLAYALSQGVTMFDTAVSYGDAEALLGRFVPPESGAAIITKTAPLGAAEAVTDSHIAHVEARFRESLKVLNRPSVSTVLLHHSLDVLRDGGEKLVEMLQAFKAEGLTERIGISIYTADEIDRILELFTPEVVQVPLNIFDQRLLKSGHLAELKRLGVEVHARSIFLQGLSLSPTDRLPAFLAPVRDTFERFSEAAQADGPVSASIRFIRQTEFVDALVVGVTTIDELSQIMDSVNETYTTNFQFDEFAIDDPQFVNPANWP